MKTLCDLQLERLTELLNSAGQNGSRIVKNSPNDPVLYLDRLSAIFRHVTLQLGESSQIIVLMYSGNIFMLVYYFFQNRDNLIRRLESQLKMLGQFSSKSVPFIQLIHELWKERVEL